MKKLFIGSGILLVLFVIMAFTGLTDRENNRIAAFNEANLQYGKGNFEQAIKLYNEAPEKIDKYLNSGNASFKLGETDKDDKQKLQHYQDAVKTYKQGIEQFPENVALKYNYEFVLKKFEPPQQDQQNQQDSDKNDKSDDKKDENQDKQDSKDQKGDGQKDQQGDQLDKQDGQQPSPSGQPDKQDGQQSSQADQSSPSPGATSSPSPGGEGSAESSELSDQELQQVMGMLEKQEQDSLKNNQEVKKEDKGGAYDW